MSFAVSICQMFLALAFGAAAVAKLADRSGTRDALVAFGAPRRLVGFGSWLLPAAELAVSVALIPAASARIAAVAAAALLAIFSVAIARTLRTGSAPDCNCFGGLTQTEVGRGTLLRNAVLAAIAIFIAASGVQVSAVHWLTVPSSADRVWVALLIAAVAALLCFCWVLLRQNGRLVQELELRADAEPRGDVSLSPLAPGTVAPAFAGRDLDGASVTLDSLLAPGLPVALFFTDPGCGACELVLDLVAESQRERQDEFTLAVISAGSIDRIEQKAAESGLQRVVPQVDDALFDAYRVRGFPALVEIDRDGSIRRAPALGADPVRAALSALLMNGSAQPIEVVNR